MHCQFILVYGLLSWIVHLVLQHALMMNPVVAKKGIMIFTEAYPARPQVRHTNEQSGVIVTLTHHGVLVLEYLGFRQY